MNPSTTCRRPFPAGYRLLTPALLLITWWAAGWPVLAQESLPPITQLRITQYAHDAWTSEDGLPQNSVSDIIQDRDGYLWVATQNGLARFDGVNFMTLTQQDGLPSDEISALLETADGTLWLGTSGGGVSRLEDGTVHTLDTDDGLRSNLIRSLYEDRDGTIWIGTIDGGLHRYDGSEIEQYGMEDGLSGNVVLAIHQANDGDLWVGTEGGLSRVRGDEITNFSSVDGLPGDLVWEIHEDADGRLWIGTSGGLGLLVNGEFSGYGTADGLCGEVVDALATDDNGTLWIGTLGGGVCRLANGHFDSFSSSDGLTNDRVRAVLIDREGNVWIGTERGGLDQFRVGKFTHIGTSEGLSHDVALSVMELSSGVVAVGTEGGGLSLIDGTAVSRITTADGLPNDNVYALAEDAEGRIWLGMYGGGVCRLASAAATRPMRCFTERDGLPSSVVYSLYADRRGRLWVGTLAGLAVIDNDRISIPEGGEALRDVAVMTIREDVHGDVWIGTYGSGMFRTQDERITPVASVNERTSDIILALHEDRSGAMWAGTQGGGLCRVTGQPMGCAGSFAGLPGDVLQIVEDDQGQLWLGGMQGIYRARLSDIESVLRGESDRVDVAHYDKADGLRVDEMNGGTQPSAWKSADGRLWFATNEGVAVIDPAHIRTNELQPPVHLDCIHVNGEHIEVDQSVELPPGSRDLVFYYTALSFTASRKVRFEYMLEGYDETWVDAGARREAYYTNLAPGSYRFVVRAANSDGVWNERGATLSVHLNPHFYQTWWFIVLCMLAALGAALLAYRMRIRHLRVRERELAQQVDARTRDLRHEKERMEDAKQVIEGQAEKLRDLNDHLEAKVSEQFDLLVKERERYEADLIDAKERAEASDRLKTAILNNLNHEFRTPLTAILGFAEIIASEAESDVKEFSAEIRSGGKRLLRTLDALLEFSRLESERTGSRVQPVDLALSAAVVVRDFQEVANRKKLPLRFNVLSPARTLLDASAVEEVIWKLVDNAVKFTSEGEVEVTVGTADGSSGDGALAAEADRSVFVRVRDTGVGIGRPFRERMYDAFTQESDGYNRTFEGVGLGLTIVKRLVEQMGGTIDVDTEEGVGSTFTVWFDAAGVEV